MISPLAPKCRYMAVPHSESDLVIWSAWTHSQTCYDKREYIENVLREYDISELHMSEEVKSRST